MGKIGKDWTESANPYQSDSKIDIENLTDIDIENLSIKSIGILWKSLCIYLIQNAVYKIIWNNILGITDYKGNYYGQQ